MTARSLVLAASTLVSSICACCNSRFSCSGKRCLCKITGCSVSAERCAHTPALLYTISKGGYNCTGCAAKLCTSQVGWPHCAARELLQKVAYRLTAIALHDYSSQLKADFLPCFLLQLAQACTWCKKMSACCINPILLVLPHAFNAVVCRHQLSYASVRLLF